MSSSSTATLSLPASGPAATPHLRAVRSVPSTAGRWHSTAPQYPAPATQPPAGAPRQPAAVPAPQSLLEALPEGAAVVAALPQSALPPGLIAQYGAQFGTAAASGQPLVGYLVLVPLESAEPAPGRPIAHVQPGGPAAPAAAPVPPQAQPARPAARGISVDLDRRSAHVDGRQLDLTYLEFELLAHLTEHPQRVHTRDHLVSAVWGYGHVGDGRTVDVHVARLRRKLGAAYRDSIVTVRRVGYKYTPVA
ncbi:winged helix-turn-helix domain-containing protein [Kitasatospora sp. HPMI-4]|uniref:winged helix-turn-helix domain-containing protein n=1 Tax=Kitasatospora sp. HPMI-4 TaxID=3448443 RepID=UPI003F193CC4